MLERFRVALVRSFVGAIALGWVFAQCIVHFANVFAAPVQGWAMRREWGGMLGHTTAPTGLTFREGAPELVKSFSLLLLGYVLLRWLYFKPLPEEAPAGEHGGDLPVSS